MGETAVNHRSGGRRDLLFRVAGLLYVALLALMIAGCGLALAFGSYRLSMFFFFAAAALLALMRIIILLAR